MGDHYQKRFIESEMDRFEKEISGLGPSRSFIPAQLRRQQQQPPPPHPHHHHGNAIPPPPPPKPTPIIISGAPQVYNPSVKAGSEVVSAAPKLNSAASSAANSNGIGVLSSSSTSSSTSAGVPKLDVPNNNKPTNSLMPKKKKKKKKKDDDKKPRKALRSAGGQIWEDITLQDWDPSDFRLFCGDLGNDVTDEVLTRVFSRYPSFQKAKVIRDKRSNKTKGFGFVSFKDPADFSRAVKELDGRYVGSRPIKLRKSNWRNRNIEEARKKDKERAQILAMIKK